MLLMFWDVMFARYVLAKCVIIGHDSKKGSRCSFAVKRVPVTRSILVIRRITAVKHNYFKVSEKFSCLSFCIFFGHHSRKTGFGVLFISTFLFTFVVKYFESYFYDGSILSFKFTFCFITLDEKTDLLMFAKGANMW